MYELHFLKKCWQVRVELRLARRSAEDRPRADGGTASRLGARPARLGERDAAARGQADGLTMNNEILGYNCLKEQKEAEERDPTPGGCGPSSSADPPSAPLPPRIDTNKHDRQLEL